MKLSTFFLLSTSASVMPNIAMASDDINQAVSIVTETLRKFDPSSTTGPSSKLSLHQTNNAGLDCMVGHSVTYEDSSGLEEVIISAESRSPPVHWSRVDSSQPFTIQPTNYKFAHNNNICVKAISTTGSCVTIEYADGQIEESCPAGDNVGSSETIEVKKVCVTSDGALYQEMESDTTLIKVVMHFGQEPSYAQGSAIAVKAGVDGEAAKCTGGTPSDANTLRVAMGTLAALVIAATSLLM